VRSMARVKPLVLFGVLLAQTGTLALQWGLRPTTPNSAAMTRREAQKESVHLQLTGLEQDDPEQEQEKREKGDDKNLAVLTEFRDKQTNSTLVACEGGLSSNSRSRLECFGIYQRGINFTKEQDVELVERIFDLRNQQSVEELLTLWKSERLLSNSKEFPPNKPHAVGPENANEVQQFETKLLGLARRVMGWKLQASDHEHETRAVKAFLDASPWPQSISSARESANATLETATVKSFLEYFRRELPYYYSACLADDCGHRDNNHHLGVIFPRKDEQGHKAAVCELIVCSTCSQVSRFPRFNALNKVLDTRRGRCGEYSVLVLVMFELLGYKTRWVVDWADHVWVEIFLHGRWTMCDPCEASIDEPLLYQSWGKNSTFIFAFEKDGSVEDVTSTYTSHTQDLVDDRRAAKGVNSTVVASLLTKARGLWKE
jgi:Transglutaminase-like superfamily